MHSGIFKELVGGLFFWVHQNEYAVINKGMQARTLVLVLIGVDWSPYENDFDSCREDSGQMD